MNRVGGLFAGRLLGGHEFLLESRNLFTQRRQHLVNAVEIGRDQSAQLFLLRAQARQLVEDLNAACAARFDAGD